MVELFARVYNAKSGQLFLVLFGLICQYQHLQRGNDFAAWPFRPGGTPSCPKGSVVFTNIQGVVIRSNWPSLKARQFSPRRCQSFSAA